MTQFSDYKIEFSRTSFLNTWTYEITTPDGDTLCPLFDGSYTSQDSAERAAAKAIELHQEKYTLTGDQLKEKVNGNKG